MASSLVFGRLIDPYISFLRDTIMDSQKRFANLELKLLVMGERIGEALQMENSADQFAGT